MVAADSAQGMLDRLDEKINTSDLANVRTTLLDLEHNPVLEQRFDLIVSTMTAHHIEDIAGLIRSLSEMVSVGGYLAIADLDLDDGEFHSDPTGVKHNGFDRDKMKHVFIDSGFGDITVETAHTLARDVPEKGEREFSVFLIVGRKG